jgi:hypothetical protein
MKFTEEKLENTFTELLGKEGFPHHLGIAIARSPDEVMNLALAKYNKGDENNFEDIAESLKIVGNYLDLLAKIFHKFDISKYFHGTTLRQLNTLNLAAEFAQQTKDIETRFMGMVKRLKAAYDICAGSEQLTQQEKDYIHFYLAVRSIVFKLTKGNAPDTAQMNARVREMIKDALESDGVEEIFKRDDIKSALKVGLILLLDEFGYPPVERDEVYVEIFEQAENFKKNRMTN